MTDLQTFNDPAFKARLQYFQTDEFLRRLDRLTRELRTGRRPGDHEFYRALGCTAAELSAWLTIVDAMRALRGEDPVHGFPALQGRGGATVDVKIAPDGALLDYRFIDWAPGVAPANAKETLQ